MDDMFLKGSDLLVLLEIFELIGVLTASISLISFRNIVPKRYEELTCDIISLVAVILVSFLGFIGSHAEVFSHPIIILAILGIGMIVSLALLLIVASVQEYRERKKEKNNEDDT